MRIAVYDFDETIAHEPRTAAMFSNLMGKRVDAIRKAKPGPALGYLRRDHHSGIPIYILTARSKTPENAIGIQRFLSAYGIHIPIQQIYMTGENSGEAKARAMHWIIRKHKPHQLSFYDDLIDNIRAIDGLISTYPHIQIKTYHVSPIS